MNISKVPFTTFKPSEEPPGLQDLPVFGYPGSDFYAIHITALVSLSISIVTSSAILVYLFTCGSTGSFYHRPIGERLVVYLAVCDLFFSISHEMDHWYMIIAEDHPPDTWCIFFAFFVQGFLLSQSIVVLFTALGAMVLVVFERQIPLGRYDWRLISVALGFPSVVGIAGSFVPFLGQSGPWCIVDMRQPYGVLVNNIYGMTIFGVFVANTICYSAVWVKIQKTTFAVTSLETSAAVEQTKKYQRTARMMMLFVVCYLFQYSPYIIQAFWTFVAVPHVAIYIVGVCLINLGGVYNAFAYTIIRRILNRTPQAPTNNSTTTTSHSHFYVSSKETEVTEI